MKVRSINGMTEGFDLEFIDHGLIGGIYVSTIKGRFDGRHIDHRMEIDARIIEKHGAERRWSEDHAALEAIGMKDVVLDI